MERTRRLLMKHTTRLALWAIATQASLLHISCAAENAAAPSRIGGTQPDYPAIAARYNVQGSVVVHLTIGTDGHVERAEILKSSADVLSRSVLEAVADWEFTKPVTPAELTMRVPFHLTTGEYAFETLPRNLESAPTDQAQVGAKIVPGWCTVKAIIDSMGTVSDRLILRASSPEFQDSCQAITVSLHFSKAPEDVHGYKRSASNGLSIEVSADMKIRITSSSGNSMSPEIAEASGSKTPVGDTRRTK
jgi:TonB family protein